MIKLAKYTGITLIVIALILGIAYPFRSDPIAVLAGKRLSGEELPYPGDWSFTNEFTTVAVESRPDDPHSVTTICILHDGTLYIPAQSGSTKNWPQYVVDDARVRIKVGDKVYPARANRETGLSFADLATSAAAKYPRFDRPEDQPKDVWLFSISQR